MSRVQLQPSELDQLDPVARAIRWWTSQMLDIVGRSPRKVVSVEAIESGAGKLPARIAVSLPDTDGFLAYAHLPKGPSAAHQRALDLRIKDLAPSTPEDLKIVATATERDEEGGATYALVMARRDRLDELELSARRRRARSLVFTVDGHPGLELTSPRSDRRSRALLVVDAAIAVGVALLAAFAVMVWATRINAEAETFAERESKLRRLAVAAETSSSDARIAQDLVNRGLLKRRASSALNALAALNEATPASAWWTKVVWTPDQVSIAGQSGNATAAIGALSSALKSWSVELAGPVAAASEAGIQSFDLVARPRDE